MTTNEYYERLHGLRHRYTKQGKFEHTFVHHNALDNMLSDPRARARLLNAVSESCDGAYLRYARTLHRRQRLAKLREYLFAHAPHLIKPLDKLLDGGKLNSRHRTALACALKQTFGNE